MVYVLLEWVGDLWDLKGGHNRRARLVTKMVAIWLELCWLSAIASIFDAFVAKALAYAAIVVGVLAAILALRLRRIDVSLPFDYSKRRVLEQWEGLSLLAEIPDGELSYLVNWVDCEKGVTNTYMAVRVHPEEIQEYVDGEISLRELICFRSTRRDLKCIIFHVDRAGNPGFASRIYFRHVFDGYFPTENTFANSQDLETCRVQRL